jgi:hypothetical protein
VKDPAEWGSKDLPAEIADLFRSVERYKRSNDQLLWAINKLCNAKKHSQLVPTIVTGAVATFRAWVPEAGHRGRASPGPGGCPTSVS